jgi:hypothetical protein|tara:strand:+ start:242 stop:520 length:279 start_codon:yes stop_codon:yes gene_type:complete
MAKGASTEQSLGNLHNKVTELFVKVLDEYESTPELANPAMLGAITKFLKDNSISLESEALDELSEMEERLAAKKRNRPNLKAVTTLPLIVNE